jgi:antitoxin VapB
MYIQDVYTETIVDNPETNRLREARQTFDLAGATASGGSLAAGSKAHRLKVFKSGNSLALRLPKALGLEAGMELELTIGAGGGYALNRIEPPKRKIDISGFAGKLPGFKPAPREDFEERPSAVARRKALSGE